MTVSVFLSSRFGEFEELRRRLVTRIDSTADMRAVALDDGRAAAPVPLSRSLSALESCDVMVLVLGSTYSDGSLVREKSITHHEYERALELEHAVFAFAPRNANFRDEQARNFATQVQSSSVLGTLLNDDEDSCDRILDSVKDHLLMLDHLADARGDVHGLGRWLIGELEALGAGHMMRDTPSTDFANQWRSYTDLLEQRRMALNALTIGAVGSARRHIRAAHERHEGDWGVEYIAARLAAVRGLPTDRPAALEHARRALRILNNFDDSIIDEPMSKSTRARRRQACLLLLAKLYRWGDDSRAAEDYLRQAAHHAARDAHLLAGTPFGGTLDARLGVERVRVLSRSKGESAEEKMARQFVNLLRDYPDFAAPLVNADDVDPFRERLRADGLTEVRRLLGHASTLGIPVQERIPRHRLEDAISAARGSAETAAETLRWSIQSVSGLMIDGDHEGRWRSEVFGERRLRLQDERRALLGRRANALADLAAAESAAGITIPDPSAGPHTNGPTRTDASHEPPGDAAASSTSADSGQPVAAEPPDVEALLAGARARLAASERRVAELQQRRSDVPENEWPKRVLPWQAKACTIVGVLAAVCLLVLPTILPVKLTLPIVLASIAYAIFIYRGVVLPVSRRGYWAVRIRRENNRRATAETSVEQLGAVVSARGRAYDVNSQLARLEIRLTQVEQQHDAAVEMHALVARSLGEDPNATSTDLCLALNRLIARNNEAFTEFPAVWWSDFVAAGYAAPGDITCIEPRDATTGGLLGTMTSRARLVRVLEVGRDGRLVVSDLCAVFPRAEVDVLRLETALEPLLALTAGDASAGTSTSAAEAPPSTPSTPLNLTDDDIDLTNIETVRIDLREPRPDT